uniref:sensor histidine kinase n=1 Tax=Streptomyces cellulosae TaxID=1968 RepID=UPI002F90C186
MPRPIDSDKPGRRGGRSRGRHAPRRLDALTRLRAQLLAIVVFATTVVVLIAAGTVALVAANGPSVGTLATAGTVLLLVVVVALVRGRGVLDAAYGRLVEEQEREVERAARQAAEEADRQHDDHLDTYLLLEKLPGEIVGAVSATVGNVVRDALASMRGELGRPVPSPAGMPPALEPLAQKVMQSILEHAAADAERQWKNIVLNLTRRVQVLLGQTLKHVEDLENDVEDGDLLKRIFRVDHSLTLTSRRLHNIVMRLDSSVQRLTQPQDIYGVLQSAVSMIEHYKRVDLPLGLKGSIVGEAAHDVSLMFAELLDNATTFSPPHTSVTVTARPARDTLRIEISDSGLRVPDEVLARLDYLLTTPRLKVTDDVTDGRTGLGVVAIVARRYRIRVKLTPSDSGNTVVLLLPAQLLVAPQSDPARSSDAPPAVVPAASARRALPSAESQGSGKPTGPVPSAYSSPAPGGPSLPRRRASVATSAQADQQPAAADPALQDQGRPRKLPRRGTGGRHMAPQLRAPRQPVQPQAENYDPGLMAAFQRGHASGEDPRQPDTPTSTVRLDTPPFPPQESR